MKTIEAMKQAHAILQSGDLLCEVTATSILREAIAAEEAQGVDPVYLVATGIVREGWETYTRHDVCPPLCDAEKLFTRPAKPPTGERAALIQRLQEIAGFSHIYENDRRTVREAADMLAADAQKSEPTEQKLPEFFASYEYAPDFSVLVSVYRRRSDALPELVHQESLVAQASIGQQVAVPQVDAAGAALDLEARAKTVESQTTERAMLHAANCLRMLAAAPQPPKADALAADHVEDVRAMVPMTEQELDDLLPTNDSMSRKDSQRWIARAVERRNGIGVKP